jgi:hypothetical protein
MSFNVRMIRNMLDRKRGSDATQLVRSTPPHSLPMRSEVGCGAIPREILAASTMT